jgi:hypothetical protein
METGWDRAALLGACWVLMIGGPLLVWLVGNPDHPWGSPLLSVVVATGLMAGAVSVVRQGTTVDPPLPRRLTRATMTVAAGALLAAGLWLLVDATLGA